MKDCSFETITEIKPHPNADKLEIAVICNYDVIVGKGEFKAGDTVFYVFEDAKLNEYDNLKNWELQRKLVDDMHSSGKMTDAEYSVKSSEIGSEYQFKFKWQKPLLGYLGSKGRVKVVRLRGVMSAGIAISLEKLYGDEYLKDGNVWKSDDEVLNSEEDSSKFVDERFGISHWVMPISGCGDLNAKGNLPWGLPKSDESNWQQLREYDLPYGERCIVTKKLDGSSMTICCAPDGEVHVTSRSMDLKLEADNNFNRAAKDVIPLGLEWAKRNNKRICLRGELTASNIQTFGCNLDRGINNGEPTFNMYGTYLPDEADSAERFGRYGTKYHFLKIRDEIRDINGVEIRCVPVVEEDVVLTKELLVKYRDMPHTFGEGVVVGFLGGKGSCKSKSLDYLSMVSKQ